MFSTFRIYNKVSFYACLFYTFLALMPLANLYHPEFVLSNFLFKALWLVYLYLFKHFFLWEYHFLFTSFWFMPTFSGTQLGHTARVACIFFPSVYVGGPKGNRTLNLAHELEVVLRCTARCCRSTQYSSIICDSSSLPRGVNLGWLILFLRLFF